jgi:hypothetical protein
MFVPAEAAVAMETPDSARWPHNTVAATAAIAATVSKVIRLVTLDPLTHA